MERDYAKEAGKSADSAFQLTRSRGAWRQRHKALRGKDNFNSHAHVERDQSIIRDCVINWSFQLTRSRGAWQGMHPGLEEGKGFQLTRSRGAWHRAFRVNLLTNDFNSHAHVERDGRICVYNSVCPYFNSHAHVERDPPIKLLCNRQNISTHTLTWSVTATLQL